MNSTERIAAAKAQIKAAAKGPTALIKLRSPPPLPETRASAMQLHQMGIINRDTLQEMLAEMEERDAWQQT
jgi:hypothetical protein